MSVRSSSKSQGGDPEVFEYRGDGLTGEIIKLLSEFEEAAESLSFGNGLRQAVVRTNLMYDHVILVSDDRIWVIGQTTTSGMCTELLIDRRGGNYTADDMLELGELDLGYSAPFVFSVPADLLEMSPKNRSDEVEALAHEWVSSEEQRVLLASRVISMDPLFGAASFVVQPQLCFVIMPFAETLTRIYTEVIKPTVESRDLVCLRADDITTNGAIMDHVWKSICEARFLIADLTSRNANVFYELGIAHTVGKETILIAQNDHGSLGRPFDVSHLRYVPYDDTPDGRAELRTNLDAMIRKIVTPTMVS